MVPEDRGRRNRRWTSRRRYNGIDVSSKCREARAEDASVIHSGENRPCISIFLRSCSLSRIVSREHAKTQSSELRRRKFGEPVWSLFQSNKAFIDLDNVARRGGQLFHDLTQIFTRQRRYLCPLPSRLLDELRILQGLAESIA